MRLTLVDNMVLPERSDVGALDVHPHLGLISLATVVRDAGHDVTIYDPKRDVRSGLLAYDATLYDALAETLLATAPDAVGFTTLGCSFLVALRVAEWLKRVEPDLPILLGGPHATMLHREILDRFPVFDVVVRHEAEETLPAVLDGLADRAFAHVPGVSWVERGAVRATEGRPMVRDLDTLPDPAYDAYPVEDLGLDYLRVEAGRGCPFSCTFCSTATFFQRSYRLKSAARLVSDLDRLHTRYGVRDFKLEHDLFTVSRAKVAEFCDAVTGRGYTWRVSARVDCVDTDLLERMAAAGCVGLYFGIETGSPRLQKVVKKRLDLDLLDPVLDTTERLGIRATVSFITGYPEEEQADQDATLRLLGRCFDRPGDSCLTQLHLLLPEPGTEQFAALGDRLGYDGHPTEFNAWLVDAEDERRVRESPDVFATYHHYPTALPRERHTFATELHAALSLLGHVVAGYLLRFYDGDLAVLANRMRTWRSDRCPDRPVDVALVAAFVAADLGRGHHVCSLVRYARAVAVVTAGHPSLGEAPAVRGYALTPGSVLLTDLHDPEALLERIRTSPGPEPVTVDDDLGCYVVVPAGDSYVSYAVDVATHAALGLFTTPRPYDEVDGVIARLTGGHGLPDGWLDRLVATGVLVPAAPEPGLAGVG